MKERCCNHADREALAPCHSCGKHFCSDCLNEGKEYYYCRAEQCQALFEQENLLFESVEEKKNAISEQRWKENGRRFYRKTGLILSIAWILLTILLFFMVPSYNEQTAYWWSPALSLIVCLKWFTLAWLIRVTVYKHLIWKRRLLEEFAVMKS